MLHSLANHKWAIFIALVIAVIAAYPQIFFHYDIKPDYRGIDIIGAAEDEFAFLTRVREVQDGHPTLSSPYHKEGKDTPYLFMPLAPMMVAYLGKIFSLDFNNTILLSRFFFPFVVFLIIYGFLLLLTKEKLTAIAISAAFLLLNSLFNTKALQLLSGQSPATNYLTLTWPVNPVLTWFFFFAFLLFFWLFLERKQWRWGIVSTVLLGLSFYSYLYTWTFLYVFCGVLLLIFLFQKKWPDVKRIGLVLLGAFLIAIPYLLNVYRALIHTNPSLEEMSKRHGLIENPVPVLGFLVPSLFIIFLLFFPRKWRERYFFSLALLITPFIVLNQQLITGINLSSGHYHWFFHKPLAMIFLLIIFFSYLSQKKWEFLRKLSAILLITASIGLGLFIQNTSYEANKSEAIYYQRYGPIVDWLNANAQKEEVVFANADISNLIVIYTPLNVFHVMPEIVTISFAASEDRLLNTLFLLYRLDGVGEDEAQEVFFKDRAQISWSIYGIYYRENAGAYANIPDEVIQDIVQKYQESFSFSTADFLYNLWNKYQVNYLIWDKEQNPQWHLDQYQFLKKAADIGDFTIYQILQ